MRKGSMQLGINAIVILIIALAILGLAMSFVTNLFRKGEGQLGSIISNVEMPVRADASQPIKFGKRDIEVKSGSADTQLKVSVYNNNNFEETDEVMLFLDCFDLEGERVDSLYLAAPPQKIPLGTDVGYGAIIVSDKNMGGTSPGTYTCRVIASTQENYETDSNAISGQIYITVRP